MNIDELLKEFNTYAESSKSKLEEMLSVISGGRIPSMTERQELDHVIECLCDKYEIVCGVAERELQEDELPEDGSPISSYYEALKNSKSAKLKVQLNEIQNVLKRYISVRSLVAKLSLALEPFQKDAESLLIRINEGEIGSVEEINDEIAGPKLFMKALECDDLNTDEGIDMLDSLEEMFSYPSRVTRGLSSKSYFISDGQLESRIKEEKMISKGEIISTEPTEELNSKAESVEAAKNIVGDELIDNSDKSNGETNTVTEEQTDVISEDKKESEFVCALREADVQLNQEQFGMLSREISPAETQKLSAKVFTNDLRKGNVKALKSIIQQIDRFPIISPKLLNVQKKMPLNIAKSSLDFLQKKGYLRKYKVVPCGEFYCCSPSVASQSFF